MSTLDFEALMQEPPGGNNFGRRDGEPLGADDSGEFLLDGGWTIVDTSSGGERRRVKAHRGVTHPDEYIDPEALRVEVENLFGFSAAQVSEAFSPGRPSASRLELRDHVDARMLEISELGGNMVALGRSLGLAIGDSGNGARCWAIERSLSRARGELA